MPEYPGTLKNSYIKMPKGGIALLLSKHTMIQLNRDYANIIGHMCYAAYKLWNVCNYERLHYRELELSRYPDWYYQKSAHKADLWYKSLPSQTAQEVLKLLDKAWKSFYALKKSGGIENPRPPYFKQEGMVITYMQMGIVHESGSDLVRLSIPKQLKEHMRSAYGIHDNFLFLKNKVFQDMDRIKQIKLYPPDRKGGCRMILIYEIPDVERKPDNGRYLSIDPGLHNLLTCYDNEGSSFIMGRNYLSICRECDKEISRVQSQWGKQQTKNGVKYPKPSKHVLRLYEKKRNKIHDYLHKVTRQIADHCKEHGINTVVIGDLQGIREGNDKGSRVNQQLHGLPYEKIYGMLEYKLTLEGISLIRQEESYSSQCSPNTPEVSKEYAKKGNRKHRGLYQENGKIWNADAVGAYNILRKYHAVSGGGFLMPVSGLDQTRVVKVAV